MFVRVCHISELPPGARKTVQVQDRHIALFHLEDGIHAIDNVCPHRGGPLAEGTMVGHVIHCPLHAWCFDVRTGNSPVYTMARVAKHDVRVVDDGVEVESEGRLPPLPEME